MSTPVSAEFRAEVRKYRDMNFTIADVAILTGKSRHQVERALKPYSPPVPQNHYVKRTHFQYTRPEDLVLADTTGLEFPILTLAGVAWTRPIKAPRANAGGVLGENICKRCSFVARCREAVKRGDLVACEQVLEKELR